MVRKLIDDCFIHDSDRLTHAQALELLRSRISPVTDPEDVPLDRATGRVLARDLTAPRPIPAFANAAVDGYAFRFHDYDAKLGSSLPVGARAAAGRAIDAPAMPGEAVRIFTGAPMPDGFDSVVMQEDTRTVKSGGAEAVNIPPGLKCGANCRLAGEDVAQGAVLLHAGQRLRPQDCAAAASAGFATLPCYGKLKVAVFSTGDEIIHPGTALADGQVYDANAPMLRGLLEAAGVQCDDLGVLADDRVLVEKKLKAAARDHHVLITSGGASKGEEDHVVKAVDALGHLHMWQIAIKPGRPMAFGQIGDCVFLGLPGNPVAVFVCFLLYVWPVLARLGGAQWREPVRYPLPAAFSVPGKKTGRREYWRGLLTRTAQGGLAAQKFERDGSGLITSLREADGLIEAGEDVGAIAKGQPVSFIPFSEFGIRRD
ncbi:MAG: gephyrin-like molybdotransferase Glp [Pseudomonadota bacterium]|nr:gephyrin-like molybdotransferase Glp [Pseudomonadota bacterium]